MTNNIDIDSLFSVFDEPEKCTPDTIVDRSCPNCSCEDDLEEVCYSCGYCRPDNISQEAEWVSGVSEDGAVHDPSRVGMASNHLYSSNWGKSTNITVNYKTRKTYGLISRINWHSSMDHRDRALYKAYEDFEKAGRGVLGLSSAVLDMAKTNYKKFSEQVLTRGSVRDGIKANCLFWACKEANFPRSTQEIADAFGIPTSDMSRTYDKAREIIKPKINAIIKPADMVPRIFNSLGFYSDRVVSRTKMKCVRVAEIVAKQPKLMGKTPVAVASAVVYRVLLGTDLEVGKDDISNATGISIATLNKIDSLVKAILPK